MKYFDISVTKAWTTGAREKAQWLKTLLLWQRTQIMFPVPYGGWRQPIISARGGPVPFPGLHQVPCTHHICDSHTYMQEQHSHAYNQNKLIIGKICTINNSISSKELNNDLNFFCCLCHWYSSLSGILASSDSHTAALKYLHTTFVEGPVCPSQGCLWIISATTNSACVWGFEHP